MVDGVVSHEQDTHIETADLNQLLEKGSTVFVLEAVFAIRMGKLQPIGYDAVAEFFRKHPGKITPAHNALLLLEADLSGKAKEARAEFPNAEQLAKLIITDMQKQHPTYLSAILKRVSGPNWSLQPAIKQGVKAEQSSPLSKAVVLPQVQSSQT